MKKSSATAVSRGATASRAGGPSQASPPPSTRRLWLPLGFIAVLAGFAVLPQIRSNPNLMWSFVGTSAAVFVWWLILMLRSRGRALTLDIVLRPEHYMQTVAQLAIYVYWSFYWQPIQDAAALIAAQIVFAY